MLVDVFAQPKWPTIMLEGYTNKKNAGVGIAAC
jgi:hypothetical protein